jgi:DNA-binding NarL/FixJ family response regulator
MSVTPLQERLAYVKVLLADNNAAMLAAMRRILSHEPGVTIVGETRTFATTVQATADNKPEVLLLDL